MLTPEALGTSGHLRHREAHRRGGLSWRRGTSSAGWWRVRACWDSSRRRPWCRLILPTTGGAVSQRSADPAAQEAPAGERRLPLGFSDSLVGDLTQPTGMAWTPDGRMLVISKLGRARRDGGGTAQPGGPRPGSRICSEVELGLLGIAVDPDFAENRFVYLYYSRDRGGECGAPGRPTSRPTRSAGSCCPTATSSTRRARRSSSTTSSPSGRTTSRATSSSARTATSTSPSATAAAAAAVAALRSLNTNAQDRASAAGQDPARRSRRQARRHQPVRRRAGSRRCTDPAGIPAGTGPCRRSSRWASATRSASRASRAPASSSSTTSASRPGRRSTSSSRVATTGGTSVRASAPEAPPPTAAGSAVSPTRSTPTRTTTTADRSRVARSSPRVCGRASRRLHLRRLRLRQALASRPAG